MEPERAHDDNNNNENEGSLPPIMEAVPIDALANIRDGVVCERTLTSYLNDTLAFLKWCTSEGNEEYNCLTDFGKAALTDMYEVQPGEREGGRPFTMRVRSTFKALLWNAHVQPIVHLNLITADGFMKYLLSLKHPTRGGSLSKSSYGSKRAALFHLYRVHNRTGMPLDITSQLANLFKGFYRRLAQNREVFEGAAVHHGDGKVQMSVDLYKIICGWLLKCGTTDGLFAHYFLTLTWNLACQSQNTSLVKL